MKKIKVLLISMALAAMLLGCSADSIMNTGKSLQNLQGINASYVAGEKIKAVEQSVEKTVEMYGTPDSPFVLPILEMEDGLNRFCGFFRDQPEIIEMRSILSKCVSDIQSAKESGVGEKKLREIFNTKVPDIENAWSNEASYNGNFSFLDVDSMLSLFGAYVRLGFPIVSAGNQAYLLEMATYSAYIAIGNHYLKDQIQDLIHGEGSQQPLPEAIQELREILTNNVFKVMENHLREGYLTYSDFVFSAMLSDIMCSAIDLLDTPDIQIDETIIDNPDIARIVSYCEAIEYLYGVDLNLIQRIVSVVSDN